MIGSAVTSVRNASARALLRVLVWVMAASLFAYSPAAHAQQIGIIRDAEIERLIKDFADPLLKAAGVPTNPRVYLVADRRFNAFVIEDGSIFLNFGTLIEVDDANALKAILAHEIGHLAGGHLARIRQQMQTNANLQIVAMLLGVGATAAASGSGQGGQVAGMASAFILASQSAGQNAIMAFRRSEESAADAAGLKLLERTGQSARGMVSVLEYLKAEEQAGFSPYVRSHPEASDRLTHVRAAAQNSPAWNRSGSAADNARLDLARAKLVGFLEGQQATLNRYPNADKSVAGRYARVIAAYKSGAGPTAIPAMQSLVSTQPNNPYFQELLGQMHYETGNPGAAIGPLSRAVRLAPAESEIRILYGQALLDAGGSNVEEAVLQLKRTTLEDPQSVRAFNVLSRAHAALGQQGEASLAAAEAALIRGDKGLALSLARKAQQELSAGSPAWLRADDILSLTR